MDLEIRSLPFDVTAQDDGDKLTVSGIVNRVGSVSEVLTNRRTGKKFRETILPGVFSRAIERAKRVDFLSMHDKNQVLSTTDNSSLELRETSEGLSMNASISGTSWGQDTYRLIHDGIIKGMSFGMRVRDQDWSSGKDGIPLRTIKDIDLFEVSAVRNPAYKSSAIEARDADQIIDVDIPDDIEERNQMSEEEKKAAAEKAAAEAAKKAGKDPEDDKEKDPKDDEEKDPEDKTSNEKKTDKKKDDKEKRSNEEDLVEEIRSLKATVSTLQSTVNDLSVYVEEKRSIEADEKAQAEEEQRSLDEKNEKLKAWFAGKK